MSKHIKTGLIVTLSASLLSGCAVVKTTGQVAALPFKAAYKTTEFVGKGVWATGKGVYYVGSVPVKITEKALDLSSDVLTVTTQTLDAAGKAVTLTRKIKAVQLDAELAAIKGTSNVLSVVVDAL
ncbi:MAG: hypothetical protein ABJG88_02615 [Litorimonas sp.]